MLAYRAGLLVTTYLQVQQVIHSKRQYGADFELTPGVPRVCMHCVCVHVGMHTSVLTARA